jgi:tetratricopeptide (TPR) repeat protein
MSSAGPVRDCLDPQVLAAFADGNLKRSEIAHVVDHLDRCARCRDALDAAIDLKEPRTENRGSNIRLLAIAAALGVIAIAVPLIHRSFFRSPEQRLADLVPRSVRNVEPRLTGGFAWKPYLGPARAADDDWTETRLMKLIGVTGDLVERAERDHTAASQRAAGIGLVLSNRPEEAAARLRAAAQSGPGDAKTWSDLAAAEYVAGRGLGRPSLYPVALADADRALRIDPRSPEALFNRALILERLGLTGAARDAWNAYLGVDPSSAWADEAREHLQRLPPVTGESQFQRAQPRLESASLAGDQAAVDAITAGHPLQCRTWAEAEYLGRWAEALQSGDGVRAARQLIVARRIGDALLRLSGEALLHDAVVAIDRASPERRAAIAAAHVVYRRGRIAYRRAGPAAAEPDLRSAAAQFAAAGDPMSLVARYYAASTRFDQNDPATARQELETLLAEASALPHYRALGAQTRWELALCAMHDDDWSATERLASAAADTFHALDEQANRAFMQTMLATALISLGQPDAGWAMRTSAFALQSAEGRDDRLLVTIDDAANIELRIGRLEAARALLDLVRAAHRAAHDDAQLSNALMREALIDAALGDDHAGASAREAMSVARRIADSGLRARAVADATFAGGAVALARNPREARELLTAAIDAYRIPGSLYLPEALLLRARASLRLGDRDAALRDLDHGVAEADRATGTDVLDARTALFDEIISLQLDRGDVAGAFASADRARARLRVAAAFSRPAEAGRSTDLQKKLRGAAVLEIIALPRELVAFCLTATTLGVFRHPVGRDALAAMRFGEDEAALRRLYDLLIRPAEPALGRATQLIVIADPLLQRVPFAALLDGSRRPLVERMTVSMASTARELRSGARAAAAPSVATIALPGGQDGAVLPDQPAEIAEVASLYARATTVEPELAALPSTRAEVLHIAGHTQRQPGAGDAALLFRQPVSWSGIASLQLPGPIVVLAACETLRVPLSPQTHALSLGGGFLAAGARSVIGTLAPLADNDAREIFRAVHRELARGRSAAAALRQAQIDAIRQEEHGRRSGWRSVAVLTNLIDPPEGG